MVAPASISDDFEEQLEQVGPFKYKIESETIVCELCKSTAAHYKVDLEEEGGNVQSRDFINLRRSLKRYLTCGKHQNVLEEGVQLHTLTLW